MKLTNFFKNDTAEHAITVNIPKKTADTQNGISFDKLINTFEKRQTKVPEQSVNKTTQENPQKPLKNKGEEQTNNNNLSEPEEKLSTQKTTESNKPKPLKAAVEDETEINMDDVIIAVAEILQVPVETLLEWMGTLNLSPVDLTDTKAVIELLQLAFDAPDTAVLLTEPEFPMVYKAINEFMATLKPETPVPFELPQETVLNVNMSVLANLHVVTDADNETVITNVQETEKVETTEFKLVQQANPIQNETETQADTQTSQNDSEPVVAQQDIIEIPVVNTNFESMAARAAEAVVNVRQTGTPINASDVMNQIISRVRAQTGEQFAELRIMLRPENLGEVSLRVLTQNGIVAAQFIAENQRIKEMLESNFNLLRDALQEQGVQISELSVSVKQGDEERMNQFAQAKQNSRARMQRINNVQVEIKEETGFGDEVDPSVVLRGNMNLTV